MTSWTLFAPARVLAAATWSSTAFLENATAWAPRLSAPLVAAVTDATTASKFFFESAFSSVNALIDFSKVSLNALLPTVVNCSTADFAASVLLAAMINSSNDDAGQGLRMLVRMRALRGPTGASSLNWHAAMQKSIKNCAVQHAAHSGASGRSPARPVKNC